MKYDVIIAGAGPVGLTLALRLARAGKKILLIEQNPTTHEHSRAPAIWPRTQEILASLGVIDTFLEEGIVNTHPTITDADNNKVLLEIPLEEVKGKTNFPQLLVIPQSKTERILYEALEKESNADVHFSSELIDCEQEEDGVSVQYKRKGKMHDVQTLYLVGCDGAHSVVRKKIGARLQGQTYSSKAGLADVRIKTDKPSPLLSTDGVIVIAIKIDKDLWRLILLYFSQKKMTLEERKTKAMNQLFPGVKYEDVWQSEFTLHNRISTRFVKGRIALAGDAAHLNSPVGGQGMNAGIQDTEVLGNALIKALDTDNPEHLSIYARKRKGAISTGVNSFTHIMTKLIFLANGKALKVIMRTWNLLLKIPFVRKRFLKKIAMLS
jgi:3-(3-hydroxy-phenyl)propionate hydroxylase